jgi:hypothetical protein
MATQAKKQAAKPAAKTASKGGAVALSDKKQHALVATGISIEADAGMGFENADKDSFAIPFMRILQSGSPQCKKANPEYIKGAEEGDFFNTVTKEVIKGSEGINVLQVHYDRKFTEWKPSRGGFAGEHLPSDPILLRAVKKVDDEGKEKLVLPNGNSIQDTRYHFCLHVKDDGSYAPVLICMSSSGIKPSKRLMTELNSLKIEKTEGGKFTPPTFMSKIHIASVPQSNDEGDWFNYDPSLNGLLDISDEADVELYMAARAFRDSIASGKSTVQHNEDEVEGAGKSNF